VKVATPPTSGAFVCPANSGPHEPNAVSATVPPMSAYV
jgi:hypothetical protein